jgi:hypothetical protein
MTTTRADEIARCPECGAEPGELCIFGGNPHTWMKHPEREERETFLRELLDTYGGSAEDLREQERRAGKPTPGGNVWPNGLD